VNQSQMIKEKAVPGRTHDQTCEQRVEWATDAQSRRRQSALRGFSGVGWCVIYVTHAQ